MQFQRENGSLITLLIGVVIVLGVLYGGWKWWKGGSVSKFTQEYQGVFITNGQVYFGKLTGMNKNFVILEDVYYLQLQKPLQDQKKDAEGNVVEAQPQLSLTKLGNEVHGPMDKLTINRQHVLFIEDLKPDSRLVKTIAEAKKKATSGETSGTVTPTPAPKEETKPETKPVEKKK